ncbi:ATP-binding protein [Paraferrimonas haliotis]|nr:ATP-binding protein [Paraferrimonas haliotis]
MLSLKRILLIDTHLPGVVELKVNGHTNICGTNASGKTTLQRLLPVFYGEAPSRVVPATRDSFQAWYLPRESSFIIYEYQRGSEQTCMAVLTASGNGVAYRFVDSAFVLEDFVEKDITGSAQSIAAAEVVRRFRANKIECSNLLNNKEYRGVIQNDRATLNRSSDKRHLLAQARTFSLSENHHSLRHIEKLIRAVHSREGKMETIKAMIAAILEEDGVQTPVSTLSRNQVDSWINECQLIRDFDVLNQEFTHVQQQNQQRLQTRTRLAQLYHQLELDKQQLITDKTESETQNTDAKTQLKQLEQSWDEQRNQLSQNLSDAKADEHSIDKALDRIEAEYDHWQDQDIETHKLNLDKLGQWQSELEGLQQNYSLLTEQHQDIEAAYNQRVAEVAERLNRQQDKLNKDRNCFQQQLTKQQGLAADAQQELLSKQGEHLQTCHQEFDEQLHNSKLELERLRSGISLAGPTASEQTEAKVMQANVDQAGIDEDALRQEFDQAESDLRTLKDKQQLQQRELDFARDKSQQALVKQQQVQSLLYPGDGTLLEFLRQQAPGWQQQLGKAIDPRLLQRKDLSPVLIDSDSPQVAAFGGVHLELGHIEEPSFARSEAELAQQLEVANQDLQAAENAQKEVEQTLVQLNDEVRQQQQAVTKVGSSLQMKTSERQRLQEAQRQLQHELSEALRQRKRQAEALFDAQKLTLSKVEQQKQQRIEQLTQEFGEQKLDLQLHWQQVCGDIQAQLDNLESQHQENNSNAKSQRKKISQWFEAELAAKDVDANAISELKQQIAEVKANIDITIQYREAVFEFNRWYQHTFVEQKSELQQAFAQSKQRVAQCDSEQQQGMAAFKAAQTTAKSNIAQWESRISHIQETLLQINELLAKLGKLDLAQDAHVEKQTVTQRISEAQQLHREHQQLTDMLEQSLRNFDNRIGLKAGTSLADFWERSRSDCYETDELGVLRLKIEVMVTRLEQLINELIPQKREALRTQGRNLGNTLSQYYSVLQNIDKAIAQQSRRISQAVEQELYLEGVSDSSVNIRSRISELEFWPELQRFSKLHEHWLLHSESQLPDQEYGDCIKRVLDILGRAVTQAGISQLLDVELHLTEGNSQLLIRTDKQLNESSSHGMAYLILCKFLLAFTRLLRGDSQVIIHWPIDEIGTLANHNVKKIFDACKNNNITVVGAFPNPESEVLNLFDNRYLIDKQTRRLQTVEPVVSELSQRIAAKRALKEQGALN